MFSSHHTDSPWCIAGLVTIMYHSTINVTTSVTYDERSVFGSHGMYATWMSTAPRSYSVSANMVGANTFECAFNILQVQIAHWWTQCSPPGCRLLVGPLGVVPLFVFVRIESYDASIEEGVHLVAVIIPLQISLSLNLKECKAI